MTADDYNRRVGPQNVISEKALLQAIEKDCAEQENCQVTMEINETALRLENATAANKS